MNSIHSPQLLKWHAAQFDREMARAAHARDVATWNNSLIIDHWAYFMSPTLKISSGGPMSRA